MKDFINLHSHTYHSHMDAIVRIPDLFKRVVDLKQPGIAITDHGVLAGIYEGYKEYKKYRDSGTPIKFIPGSEIYYCDDLSNPKSKRRHLVVLAKNEEGYRNLLKINYEGFCNSVTVMGRQFPRVDLNILKKYGDGLFVNSACGGSPFAAAVFEKNLDKAGSIVRQFHDIFGDQFSIELQPHEMRRGEYNQAYLNEQLKFLAEQNGVNVLATCDSHYIEPGHEKYHDMILAIGSKKPLEDPTRHRYATYQDCMVCEASGVFPKDSTKECYACYGLKYSSIKACPEFYLKDRDHLEGYFSKRFDTAFANALLDRSIQIAEQCEFPDYMEPKGHRLPKFDWKIEKDAEDFERWPNRVDDIPEDAAYLRFKVKKSFDLYTANMKREDKAKYWARIRAEVEILESKDFSSYMLIVADYINWAKGNDIVVGPGRGSVGGSLVAFLLGIHSADPIKYGLIFERFQNKQKKALPDIDTDFSPVGRERVVEYCEQRYGKECVAYISNILRLTPKIIIKDVARSLILGGDKSSAFRIANDVTADIPDIIINDEKRIKVDTMEKALGVSRKLRDFVAQYPAMMEYGAALTGIPRGFATHAAGIVIGDVPLHELAPMRRDNDGKWSVQYDKDTCEEIGLVKMDFLGLETLDILSETRSIAGGIGIILPKTNEIEDGDAATYKLISAGQTAGIFQLNGTMTPLCVAMKPASIPDIAAISAIGRPSVSKSDRVEFIKRRFGHSPISYTHKILEPVFKHTYGISVYEEDLLKLASHVAGWDLSEADGLRKMTKSKEKGEELARTLGAKFVNDAMSHSKLSRQDAEMIWEKAVLPFVGYGFNLSHAILYSMTSYHTAYYKAHAPGPFLCANLNAQTRGNKKDRGELIDSFKKECKAIGIKILPCDINHSKEYYSMKDSKAILTGLGAIKGIGVKALDAMIANQPYENFYDFLYKTPSNSVNKGVIQALAHAGAFDAFGWSRKFIVENIEQIRKDLLKFVKKNGVERDVEIEEVEEIIDADAQDTEVGEDIAPKVTRVRSVKKKLILESGALSAFESSCVTPDAVAAEYELRDLLEGEKLTLGEYLSSDLTVLFPNFFVGGKYATPFSKIQALAPNINFPAEGIISSIREFTIKKEGRNRGKQMAKFVFENVVGESTEVLVWCSEYEKYRRYIKAGIPIRGMFKIHSDSGSPKILVMVNLEAYYKGGN